MFHVEHFLTQHSAFTPKRLKNTPQKQVSLTLDLNHATKLQQKKTKPLFHVKQTQLTISFSKDTDFRNNVSRET